MDYVLGTKVTNLSPLARLEVDGEKLGRELVRAYLHQIIIDGFFHADPHPGNVFLTDDGRVALLDLGWSASCRHESRKGFSSCLSAPLKAGRTRPPTSLSSWASGSRISTKRDCGAM